MSDKDNIEKISNNSLSIKLRTAVTGLRIGLRRFYQKMTPGMRWILIIILSLVLFSSATTIVSEQLSGSSSNKLLSKETIAKQASARLFQLSEAISNLRDTVGTDSIFVEELQSGSSPSTLFETVFRLDSLKENKFFEILPFTESKKFSFLKGRGVAYYDAGRHLTAWYSTRIGTANFDSLFSYTALLEKRSKTILLDNEQIFSWIVAIRKIISKDGALLGYVTSKAMIGERFPLGGADEHPLTVFDDIISKSGREVQFSFIPFPGETNRSKNIYPIYLFPNDSSVIVGYLNIGDTPLVLQSGFQKIVRFIRDCAFVLFIVIFFWFACWYMAQLGCQNSAIVSKLVSLGTIFVILAIGRALLLLTDSLSQIVPQTLQDPQDFALLSAFGLLSNPLQLFTTVLFVSVFLALNWVIFVPERPEWKVPVEHEQKPEPPGEEEETVVFSTSGWLAKIASIVCMILLLPLTNIVFTWVCNMLVTNGSYHYLGNRFGFTRGSFTLMEASFLLVGLSYFFSALLILFWTLRSMIRLTASELSPSRSYLGHYILFTVIMTSVGWLLSPKVLFIYPEIYWTIISFILCLVTVIIFTRDIALLRTGQKGPSFFYRIPRSGLALLFLLTGAGFLLSPIIATQEYSNDIDIIKQNLRQNSQVNDLNYSSFLDQTFLSLSSEVSSSLSPLLQTSTDIKNLAFNIWLKQFSETANRNVIIEIEDLHGRILSHFAQNATTEDEVRLAGIRDSLFTALLTQNKKTPSDPGAPSYLLGSEPCFTPSCTPASIGTGLITFSGLKGHGSRLLDSLEGSKLLISISVWNDLFPQTAVNNLYDIVRTSGISADKLTWQDQDVFYAQYQNGFLQNSSTSVVELPPHLISNISAALKKNEFAAREGSIEGNRSYTLYHMVGGQEGSERRLIAATIFIPGINSLIELTLSLNTVSLFIGFFLIFFALLLRSLFSKGKRGTLKFRDRIFLIVLTIALVPLVIVTNITRSLLVEREQRIEREHLQRDAEIIAEKLQRTLSKSDSARSSSLNTVLSDLSRTIGRDISFYNIHGILSATNRPELYESSILPNQLSSETVRSMLGRQKSFSIEPLASASGSFDIGYKVVQPPSAEGLFGIVGVTSFQSMQIIESNIARTIELMYGAFAGLGIILLLIGAWISVRVAAPIQQLIAATEQVTEGRLETIVNIKRKDEVGELAQAFNRMTSELERTRENVAQSEREGAWKEMARQVAHEIKNPLTPMKLSVQHVEHSYETGDTNFGSVFKRVIRTLSEQIDVLTRIATEFSRFGEMPRRKYGFVSLKKVVESAIALYDAERGRVRFVVDIAKNLPPMYADDEEFRRALVNLIRNALQATEGWGIILISAREKSGLIHLKISDTGGGMSPETLKKAFDPNFSTKTSGMGLGLAIVKKIITDMSGTISVESTLGKGTTFHIELPAREYPPE